MVAALPPSVERFRTLLRFPTVSRANEDAIDWMPFDAFIAALTELYPAVHATLDVERIAGHSLLYRWRGLDSTLDPVVLMAHYDVVPASDGDWEHRPFAAEVTGEGDEAILWGRGAIDNKGSLVAILEAVESLSAAGFAPSRDVVLFFGHNEETAGAGAATAVEVLQARDIQAALVLDEGGAVVEGIFPGVSKPAAVVGVSEKGIVNVELSVEQAGGHASTPPQRTATARLARAVTRLTRKPFARRLPEPTAEMIATLGAHASGPMRFVFTRPRLFAPLLIAVFSRLTDETRAMIRTTAAVTQLSGSAAANVLAERATATVNIRVAVGSSVEHALAHVRRAVVDDGVEIRVLEASEPSPVSPSSGPEWDILATAISSVFETAIVTPYVQLGASDSRRFTAISRNVYRFTPFELSKVQRDSLHAANEHIPLATWQRGIRFYEKLIRSV